VVLTIHDEVVLECPDQGVRPKAMVQI